MLLTWHNLFYYQELMNDIRNAIMEKKINVFLKDFNNLQKSGDLP